MLKDKMQTALNDHLGKEVFSSYLYFSMASYFESINLKGFANWMMVQAEEEDVHVMKFYGFINDRRGRVRLKAIEAPQAEWESPLAAFEASYKHECYISEEIHKLIDLARELSDHPTDNFLQWFVGEQVEEESSVDAIVQQLKLIGNDAQGLFMLDRELGQRVFTPPATGAGA